MCSDHCSHPVLPEYWILSSQIWLRSELDTSYSCKPSRVFEPNRQPRYSGTLVPPFGGVVPKTPFHADGTKTPDLADRIDPEHGVSLHETRCNRLTWPRISERNASILRERKADCKKSAFGSLFPPFGGVVQRTPSCGGVTRRGSSAVDVTAAL